MQQVAGGGWKINGSGTTINGQKGTFISDPVTGSISINLNGGNDNLSVHDGSIPGHLTVMMGDGNDKAHLSDLQLGTFLHFEGGAGNDTLAVSSVHVTDETFAFFSTIDMQDGNDSVSINHFVDQDLEITLGAGNDTMSMMNSQLLGGPFQRLRIDAGDGSDAVSLNSVKTGPLYIEMGPGNNDSLIASQVTADTANILDTAGKKGSISGNSDHIGSQTIDPNFTIHYGDLSHNT
jgi:hypothetical protein